jgi:hypothetical protein
MPSVVWMAMNDDAGLDTDIVNRAELCTIKHYHFQV